ncbi:MAG: GIY-YIG nuclease family protein [Patescibacteria group bacterium]
MKLINKAKKLPNKPGVYIFLDKDKGVLYVGRAVSVRNRVLSYFRDDLETSKKEMVESAAIIKHYITDTVLESVVLEANLIKKHWPKYNVKDKDDRSFSYIIVDKGDYPRPIVIRGTTLKNFPADNFLIFGPYQSSKIARDILRVIRRIFPYSVCKPFSNKPCFHYQIRLCPGLCVGKISKTDYKKNIRNIVLFLRGEKKRLLKKLIKENPDKIKSLAHVQDTVLITRENILSQGFNRVEGYDISHFAGKETYGAMVVFTGGEKNTDEYRLFKIKSAPAGNDLEALKEVVQRRFKHKEWPAPDIILIDGGRPQVVYIGRFLRSINVNIPIIGVSKLRGDALVFGAGAGHPFKDLALASKNLLLAARDEAHRFSRTAHRRARGKKSLLTFNL